MFSIKNARNSQRGALDASLVSPITLQKNKHRTTLDAGCSSYNQHTLDQYQKQNTFNNYYE